MDFELSDEQRMLVEVAEQFAKSLDTDLGPDEYPWHVVRAFADAGLTGIAIPEEDGGQGGTLLDSVLAIQAVARVHPRAADMLQATNFGAMRHIAAFGTPEQKENYLAPVLRGEALVTVGMSETEAGSAVSDLRTTARLEGDVVVLNGTKLYNSDGPYATHHVVWARFGEGMPGIGAVIVPTDAPGFTHGKKERFISGEAHCTLILEECRVPAGNVLLWEDGFKRMLQQFNIERLGNASRSLGYGERAFALAVEHALRREQFGRPIAEFQGLQWRFADLKVQLDSARMLLYRAASEPGGVPTAIDTAIAKLACNEVGFRAADAALQVFGGLGFSTESELGYLFTRTRGWMIAGGSVEILRNRIAESVFDRRFRQRPLWIEPVAIS
jgi:alkylation response protein AidB-like acyl-CoA dehydrogenase